MIPRPYFIYALIDPVTSQIRYIGKTHNPKYRYSHHVAPSSLRKKSHKTHWISSLIEKGVKPLIRIVAQVDEEKANEMEIETIRRCRAMGIPLTNATDGGEGTPGYTPSFEQRKKHSEMMKGHPVSAETRAKMSASGKGRCVSEKTREILRRTHLGKKLPFEQIQKMRIKLMGNKHTLGLIHSEETRQKMSKAHTGKKLTQDHIERARAALIGRKFSAEHRQRLSEIRQGQHKGNSFALGYRHNEETKKIMSEASRKMWALRKAKASVNT